MTYETSWTYDDVGRPETRTLPSGVVTTWTWDARDRIESVVHTAPGGAVLASETYTRTRSGEPTRIDREDGSAVILEYDNALRLTLERVVDDAGAVIRERSYTYDRDGNRLTRNTVGGPSETYTYGPGFQLASVSDGASTANYNHDAGGRVDAFDGNTLTYDTMDHVTQVTTGSATYDYTYDGEGRRIGWTDGTVNRDVLVASGRAANGPGYKSPLLVSDAGGAPVRSYIYAGEHALMRVEDSGAGPEATYYLRDAMGSVIALADASGNRVARFDYDAFGGVESATGVGAALPADGDFRHHGMWLDPHGLYHVRNRTYDANTGRFTSKDPVEAGDAVPEAWMPYVANRGNPFVWRDPEGLFTLLGISVSVNIEGSGNIVQATTAQQARERIVEELGSAVGQLIINAIGGILPASFGVSGGRDFEDLAGFNLCSILPTGLSTGLGWVHLEVPISSSDGKPLGEGFNCTVDPPLSLADVRAGINAATRLTRSNTTPDFVFSSQAMEAVRDGRARSFLIGDFKFTLGSNYPASQGRINQVTRMLRHAKNYGSRVAFLVVARRVPRAIEANLKRLALPSGVFLGIASP